MSSYTPIRIRTLKADVKIPFNLFIYFKDQYINYIKPDSVIEKDKFKKLKKQKIAKFFIEESDETTYQNFLDSLLEATLNDSNADVSDKVDLVEGQSADAIDSLAKDPGSEQSFDKTRKASRNIQKLLKENPTSLKHMYGEQGEESEEIVKHSMRVAALSLKLGSALSLDQEDLDYLTTASLMHDIGLLQKTENITELFHKKSPDMSLDEKKSYFDHCNSIATLLQDKPFINEKIIDLIYHHEENLTGKGPLKKTKLTLPQTVLSLANCYDKKLVIDKKTPVETVKSMLIEEMGNYDLAHLQTLQKLVNTEMKA